jgi:hypothetical protein
LGVGGAALGDSPDVLATDHGSTGGTIGKPEVARSVNSAIAKRGDPFADVTVHGEVLSVTDLTGGPVRSVTSLRPMRVVNPAFGQGEKTPERIRGVVAGRGSGGNDIGVLLIGALDVALIVAPCGVF